MDAPRLAREVVTQSARPGALRETAMELERRPMAENERAHWRREVKTANPAALSRLSAAATAGGPHW
jgi:hypothetical protein